MMRHFIQKSGLIGLLFLLATRASGQFYAPDFRAILSDDLAENSALLYFDNSYWTVNDGGNAGILYKLNAPDFGIVAALEVEGGSNRDWEALAQSESKVFIGDFGNNLGNRRDLCIYILDKAELGAGRAVARDSILFEYADQTDFGKRNQAHNFDCEAFIYKNDSLYLFTKNWVDKQANYYVLPARGGRYKAEWRGRVGTDFLVTDATYEPSTGRLVLVGYSGRSGACYIWRAEGDWEKGRRVSLPHALHLGQLEGVCVGEAGDVYLSAERFGRGILATMQGVWRLPLGRLFGEKKGRR